MARLNDVDEFKSNIIRKVNDCCRVLAADDESLETFRLVLTRLERLRTDLGHAYPMFEEVQFSTISKSMNGLIDAISGSVESARRDAGEPTRFQCQRVSCGSRRPPKFTVTKAQLEFLTACRFTKKKIAVMLNVSTKTVTRRMRDFSLEVSQYSDITDEELDEKIIFILQDNRRIGVNTVNVHLRNISIHVPRERVRLSMRRVDSVGVALRARRVIKRRTYQVHGPNSLWHLDGNHKLIRWRIVVHGALDGYSRLVLFLKASSDNKATTVSPLFEKAVVEYGWPSRIRVDRGGVNKLVCDSMERYRGAGRGSVIKGRSVHNVRIERLWGDVWNNSLNVFYDLFKQFEDDGVLNTNSEEQIFALHFIFLPRIKKSLDNFISTWNHHRLRTEHASPLQLFVERSLELQGSTHTGIRQIFAPNHDNESENGEENSASGLENDDNLTIVNVPETEMPLTNEEVEELKSLVNPIGDVAEVDKGLNKYFKVLDYIAEKRGFL